MAEQKLLKDKKAPEFKLGLANAPVKKKISFFSAIIMVIGSVMGAGMFFKSQTVLASSQGSILFSIFCWLLTALAIVLMAMALIEIGSVRNDNLSLIGWCQTFNTRFLYKACANFMAYVYIPLTYFFLPLYFIQSIQTGIATIPGVNHDLLLGSASGENWHWVIVTFLTLIVTLYFVLVCGFSSKAGNIQNWIITSINFIPVFIVIIMGIWGATAIGGLAGGQAGVNSGLITQDKIIYDWVNFVPTVGEDGINTLSFQALTPGIGLFIGMGAIFFAYDGFYIAAGIQSEMKEPKKTPYAILYGLMSITVVYLAVAIVTSIASTNGAPSGLEWIFKSKTNYVLFADGKGRDLSWLFSIFQITIGIGVLSIINAFGIWSPRFYEDLIASDELPFSKKYVTKLSKDKPKVGIVYNLITTVPIIIVFCMIGALGYVNTANYDISLGDKLTRMYSFGDLMGNWSAVGVFTFIWIPIIGALKNRKTNKVRTAKLKGFVPIAWACVIIMSLPIFMTYFVPIADLFLLFKVPTTLPKYVNDYLIPRIMIVIVLGLYLFFTFLPTIIIDYVAIKKYGNLENYYLHSARVFAKVQNISVREYVFNTLKTTKRAELQDWEKRVLNREQLTPKEIDMIFASAY